MTSEDLRAKSMLGSNWNDHSCRHWLLRIVAWWRFSCSYRAPNHEHPFISQSQTCWSMSCWHSTRRTWKDSHTLMLALNSVQSRPRLRRIFYSDTKWNDCGVILTQKKQQTKTPQNKFSYISTSKAAGNNKSNFKNKYVCLLALCERAKSRNDWCFRLRLYEYFLCQAFQFRERLDATTTFCNVADRFTLRSLTLFRVCSCVYVNFSFMKPQQKLSLFFWAKESGNGKWRSRWTGGDKWRRWRN